MEVLVGAGCGGNKDWSIEGSGGGSKMLESTGGGGGKTVGSVRVAVGNSGGGGGDERTWDLEASIAGAERSK